MRKDKDKAIELRKYGKSYGEISSALGIPRSTLSKWFGREDWSAAVRADLSRVARVAHTTRIVELNAVRGARLKELYEEARKEAAEDLKRYRYNPLFIAGLMLYWGEGDRVSRRQVRISSSDPLMIKLFTLFLETLCQVPSEKIKAQLLIYPDMDGDSSLRFWSFATGIPLKRFTKSVVIEGRHKTRKVGQGVCTVVVSSAYLKVKVLEWLKLFPKELMEKQYYESIAS